MQNTSKFLEIKSKNEFGENKLNNITLLCVPTITSIKFICENTDPATYSISIWNENFKINEYCFTNADRALEVFEEFKKVLNNNSNIATVEIKSNITLI